MSRTVAIICRVWQLIAIYPCIFVVHGDILSVSTYPDASSSPSERSGPRVQKRTSDYSHGSHASCVHSIENTSDYSDSSHHASCMYSF